MAAERDLPSLGALLGGGKYRLERSVGEGGMGAVYEATNLDTTRRVAIKVLRPDLASRADVVRRFAQEARAACRIEHPNIVGVFDLVQEGATVFIVEEFLDGEDLKQRVISQGPMDAAEALRVVIPVMEALSYAHGRGVVHRDVKPDNIFLARTPKGLSPKVIDFGIARVVDDEGESLQGTMLGEVMGTAYYMSPEQARGDTELVDGRSDVWSLGAVLYFAVSGARPFEAANRHQLLYRITHDEPLPLAERARGVAPEFVDLVRHALTRDLDKRFASMDAFLNASREVLSSISDRTAVMPVAAPEVTVSEDTHTIIPLGLSSIEEVAVDEPVAVMPALPVVPSSVATQPLGVTRKVSEVTPASWETSEVVEPPRRSRRVVWASLFAVAIALGAVVGVSGRGPDEAVTTAPRPIMIAAPRTPLPSTPISLLQIPTTRPAQTPTAQTPTAQTPTAQTPTAQLGDASVAVAPATSEPARAPKDRADELRLHAPRGPAATRVQRPPASAAQLAPNPYDTPVRPMPRGLWGPR